MVINFQKVNSLIFAKNLKPHKNMNQKKHVFLFFFWQIFIIFEFPLNFFKYELFFIVNQSLNLDLILWKNLTKPLTEDLQ